MYFSIYFFFFKQKTAYEMRISDWSSDVCSSDLRKERLRHLRRQDITDAALVDQMAGMDQEMPVRLEGRREERKAVDMVPVGMRQQQIGRASCRERVCQYV